MPNKLFIRPQTAYFADTTLFEWSLYDLTGTQLKIGSPSPLEAIDQSMMQNGIEGAEVILLWPGNMAFNSRVTVPGNQARYLQQALPFLVEEQVAQDIDSLHLSVGAKQSGGEYSVVGIDNGLFESAYDFISMHCESGTLKGAFLDAQMLVTGDSDLFIYIGSERVLLKTKTGEAISLSQSNLVAYLDSLVAEEEDLDWSVKVFLAEGANTSMLMAELEQFDALDIESHDTPLSELELLSEGYFSQSQNAVDLCQGDYKVQSTGNSAWKRWRSVAVIAGIGFLLQLGVFIGKGMYYQDQATLVGEQALAQYKKVVPNSKRVTVDKLPRIIKGKLNQSRNQSTADVDFMSLLGEAGHQFNLTKNKTNFAFKSVSYNQQRGELVMEMQANSFDQLEQLKQAIVASGLTAKISSAVQEENFYRGRISVSGS